LLETRKYAQIEPQIGVIWDAIGSLLFSQQTTDTTSSIGEAPLVNVVGVNGVCDKFGMGGRGEITDRLLLYALAGVTVLGVVLMVGVRRFLAPPQKPPAYTGPRPAQAEDGYISHTESILIDAPIDEFREWVNHSELEDLGLESDNTPNVVRTEVIRGTWDPDQDRVGDRRRVVLDDGHFTVEEILVDDPDVFRYIVWGYTNYARLMIDHALGE
jgi:hypothetical protein